MVHGIRWGRMTYCYYQGKPTVVSLHACYRYCYILTHLLFRPQTYRKPVKSKKLRGKAVKIGVQISLLQTMALSVNRLNVDMKMLFLTDKCSFWWQNHKMFFLSFNGGWNWVWLNFESTARITEKQTQNYFNDTFDRTFLFFYQCR